MAGNGKIALALLIGAAAGAAIGLLFAPAKGEETWNKISEGVKDLNRKMNGTGGIPTPGDLSEEGSQIRSNATRHV